MHKSHQARLTGFSNQLNEQHAHQMNTLKEDYENQLSTLQETLKSLQEPAAISNLEEEKAKEMCNKHFAKQNNMTKRRRNRVSLELMQILEEMEEGIERMATLSLTPLESAPSSGYSSNSGSDIEEPVQTKEKMKLKRPTFREVCEMFAVACEPAPISTVVRVYSRIPVRKQRAPHRMPFEGIE